MTTLQNETERVGATGKQEDCPCCNDEYSDRWCYCPPSCPDYDPKSSRPEAP